MPLAPFLARLPQSRIVRVPGLAVFLTGNPDYVPTSLLHNLKHNKVLHEQRAVRDGAERGRAGGVGRSAAPRSPSWRRASTAWCCATASWRARTSRATLDDLDGAIRFDPMQASYFLGREVAGARHGAEAVLVAPLAVPGDGAQRGPGDRILPHPERPGGGTGSAGGDLTGAMPQPRHTRIVAVLTSGREQPSISGAETLELHAFLTPDARLDLANQRIEQPVRRLRDGRPTWIGWLFAAEEKWALRGDNGEDAPLWVRERRSPPPRRTPYVAWPGRRGPGVPRSERDGSGGVSHQDPTGQPARRTVQVMAEAGCGPSGK